jgi:hypothetical protein
LVCYAPDIDDLNGKFHRLASEATPTANRLKTVFNRLGAYPDWDAEHLAELRSFRNTMSPSQIKIRLTGSELDAALADPRIFPTWQDPRDRKRRAARLFEWLSALATLVARVAVLVPDGYTRFVEPIAAHRDDDALRFVSRVTEAITTRHVYYASVLTEEALALLAACMDRMLAERVFDPDSYRAGEINTHDLYPMVISFLLLTVENAPGAARFANGDWTDLPRLMPLIEKLMMAAGWSAGVMNQYLRLCERAASDFPVEAFERHVGHCMDARGFRQEAWNGSGTFAGVSGAVQCLAEAHHPLTQEQARRLLLLLDRLVDMGDRRAAALQQSEHFRNIQISA